MKFTIESKYNIGDTVKVQLHEDFYIIGTIVDIKCEKRWLFYDGWKVYYSVQTEDEIYNDILDIEIMWKEEAI